MTTDTLLNDSEIRIGKVLALVSFATFIINGIFIRSEVLVLTAGVSGLASLLLILPRWVNFPSHLKMMLGILLAAVFLVSYKVLFFPVAFTFLATVPAAIAVAMYIEAFPDLFRIRWVLYALLGYVLLSFAAGMTAEEIMAGSRNQVSVILISLGALALALDPRKGDVIVVVLIFAACVLAVGSSGIVASSVLVMATLFRQTQRGYVRILIVIGVVITLVGFQFYFEYYAPPDLGAKLSYERLTGTDVRYQIIQEYTKRYTSGAFLWLGAPDLYDFYVFSSVSSGGIWVYVDSLHNSYLSVHAKIGVLAPLVYALILHVAWWLRRDLYP